MAIIDFEPLFRASPNPYVLLDGDLVIRDMNDAYLRVTMRQRADIIDRAMFEAFPSEPGSESYRQLRASFDRVLREGATDELPLIKYDIRAPDGQLEARYWSATHIPLRDAAGAVEYVLQHTVDVTELHRLRSIARDAERDAGAEARVVPIETDVLRRAEAVSQVNLALSAESEGLRALFQQAPGFIAVLTGPDHVFAVANPAYGELVGRRSVIGQRARDALPEVVEQGFIDLLDQVFTSGQPFVGKGVTVQLGADDGALQDRFIDFVYQPIHGADGATLGILVQGHDVTEQKHAEEGLRESERRFRTLADAMPNIVWSATPDGVVDYFNERWSQYTGLSLEQSSGAGWRDVVHPDDSPSTDHRWAHSLRTGAPYEVEYRFRGSDGGYRWFIGRALAVRNDAGEIERWFGACADIDDLKRAQQQALESQQRAIIAEAETRRLAEALALRVADLDALNAEIQRFAYVVSHDLRAPLVNIMGFTTELENARVVLEAAARDGESGSPAAQAALREDIPEAIHFIRASSEKMERLIAAILKLSREGRRMLTPEPLDMTALLTAQRAHLAHMLSERGAEMVIGDAPDLVGDRLVVEQIFGNLLENAVKYLDPARPGRIRVSGVAEGETARFEIADNGRGIDPRDFQRIFDLFRRSGLQDQPGEGIGLAHVRSLVRRLGGSISVESSLGKGSTFVVTIPLELTAAGAV